MNKYEKKLQYLKSEWIGEVMTIEELDRLSEDSSQWDDGCTYINFLVEGCRAFCNYVIYNSNNDNENNDIYTEDEEFEYFGDNDTELKYNDDIEVQGIWAKFNILDEYVKDADWNDASNVHIKIKDFEIY